MTYYNEGTEINISFKSNGFIMVSCTSPEPRFTDSYYNMTVEQFNQLKKILFDAQKIGVATLPGFEIDFNGISYSAFGKTGTVNEMQANALALAITNQELTLMPEDTEELALALNGKKTHIRKKDFLVFAQECEIPANSAEKMIEKILSLKEKYQNMCNESLLPLHLKKRFSQLIGKRCEVLE